MKAIVLAAGSSTRLYPASLPISKILLPIYNKPMIYYPLSTIMLAGIREVLVITSQHDRALFERVLANGHQWGIHVDYAIQMIPRGIADAFIIGKQFIGSSPVCLMLGDNIVYGKSASSLFPDVNKFTQGAVVYGYHVEDPERFGVLQLDANGKVADIIEKPKNPPSSYAVIGLYFYDNHVVEIAEALQPSARGELEITDVNREYLKRGFLDARLFEKDVVWFDTGTHDALVDASCFVQKIYREQKINIGCPEEIAWRNGWITTEELQRLAEPLVKSGYGRYLLELIA